MDSTAQDLRVAAANNEDVSVDILAVTKVLLGLLQQLHVFWVIDETLEPGTEHPDLPLQDFTGLDRDEQQPAACVGRRCLRIELEAGVDESLVNRSAEMICRERMMHGIRAHQSRPNMQENGIASGSKPALRYTTSRRELQQTIGNRARPAECAQVAGERELILPVSITTTLSSVAAQKQRSERRRITTLRDCVVELVQHGPCGGGRVNAARCSQGCCRDDRQRLRLEGPAQITSCRRGLGRGLSICNFPSLVSARFGLHTCSADWGLCEVREGKCFRRGNPERGKFTLDSHIADR